MNTYSAILQECDAALRAGRADRAAHALASLNVRRLPREWRLPFANACWRGGMWMLGLKILGPVVQEEKPTPAEMAEYALLLHKNGLEAEALRRLDGLRAEDVPDLLKHKAFCHLVRWEYDRGAQLLRQYLIGRELSYPVFVAQVNLIAAYVAMRSFEEALAELEPAMKHAANSGHNRLLANCFELRAQIHLQCGRLSEARADLEEARRRLQAEKTSDQLFVLKWLAVLESKQSGSVQPIEVFRREALHRRHWESVREADFFRLKTCFDADSFDHLVFGTPFPFYRGRVMADLGRIPAAESYVFGAKSGEVVDIDERAMPAKVRALINVLLKDFYRPARVGALFTDLFPEEHFNAFTSPNRVHQLIHRSRAWLKAEGIAAEIAEDSGAFRLVVKGSAGFRVPFCRDPADTLPLWNRLKSEVGSVFSASHAASVLQVHPSTIHRLCRWAADRGLVERRGTTRGASYRRLAA